ncbi:hypothetical protein Pint_31326 [Pistacia integerrima]|uniref:Uncharacterized protein n=1 Tax=Pistacia integerrima TaxID=434235 RepID=A0ACC0XQ88_9ROSI|nr:hypothetical protein Pint_31326 [Pistacia integerrima]
MFGAACAQLSPTFYATSCPNVTSIVRGVVQQARNKDISESGCDASLLLDDADRIVSEKNARPNLSIDGYAVIDDVKTALENVCPGVVSCADILALASEILVVLDGGQSWQVQLGRRDSRTANSAGTTAIPVHIQSGGRAQCDSFSQRLDATNPNPNIDPTFLQTLQQNCPSGSPTNLNDLDVKTPDEFDNSYFINLQNNRGLLKTDQDLFSTFGSDTVAIVNRFASCPPNFFDAFGESMIKMGNINLLTGSKGEIRINCKRIN